MVHRGDNGKENGNYYLCIYIYIEIIYTDIYIYIDI